MTVAARVAEGAGMDATRFDKRSTAEQVLAGLDLTGRVFLVTGCASGIGFETMRALAGRGGHVIGTGRTLQRAAEACGRVAGPTTPVACDQEDFAAVAAAAVVVRQLGLTLDAIIGNAGIFLPKTAAPRYGVESQFRVNHLSHMLLVTRLADLLREGTGRLVMVSSSAAQSFAPKEGVAFDNLDAHLGYKATRFYGQSKLANLTFAKSMAGRLRGRGVCANALHPGVIFSTGIGRGLGPVGQAGMRVAGLFTKSIAAGAATQCLLAAHPGLAGVSGGFYADCQPAKANPLSDDVGFQERLWSVSEGILAEHAPK